jgi:N-acyl-D-aspartate/D-glutamate deacylase
MNSKSSLPLALALTLFMGDPAVGASATTYDLIIRHGQVLDGSGNPWIRADIGIKEDRIASVGDLSDGRAARVIDASGLFVAPGFIDTHSHAAAGLADPERASARALVAQGITTVLINPDGSGPVDTAGQAEGLRAQGIGVNAGLFVPHGSVRGRVVGQEDRRATEKEMDEMRALVRKGMAAGAFGLSSGPFYTPGSFAPTSELIELAKVAAEFGGTYQSHIRDESDYSIGVVAAVDEVIEIAEAGDLPGIVTHIKVLGPRVWGYSAALIHRIERARDRGVEVFADQYPYTASATSLSAGLIPRWALDGGRAEFLHRLQNPADRARIREDMLDNLDRRGGGDRIRIAQSSGEPALTGKFLSEIARERGLSEVDAAMQILEAGSPGMVSFNMHEKDVAAFMQQPWTMTASDGGLPRMGVGLPHPRSYGAFPRKIREYVLEREVIDLATAIRSMTHLPASVYRIRDRGLLREGAYADIVIFDLGRINDPADFADPHQLAQGMVYVLINGQFAIDQGNPMAGLPGEVLRR